MTIILQTHELTEIYSLLRAVSSTTIKMMTGKMKPTGDAVTIQLKKRNEQ
jgi:ABC-type uncharacterized transport system ATPase subunit